MTAHAPPGESRRLSGGLRNRGVTPTARDAMSPRDRRVAQGHRLRPRRRRTIFSGGRFGVRRAHDLQPLAPRRRALLTRVRELSGQGDVDEPVCAARGHSGRGFSPEPLPCGMRHGKPAE